MGPPLIGHDDRGAIAAWAAYATEQLKAYAPLSWVLAALVAGVLCSVIFWLIAAGASLWTSTSIRKQMYEKTPPSINQLDTTFQKQRIKIEELALPFDPVVRDKTFIECQLLGPCNIALRGRGSITSCGFVHAAGVLIKEEASVPVGILFLNCTFLRCRIYRVLLFASLGEYERLSKGIPGLPWITAEPTQSSGELARDLPKQEPPRPA
jgi:hypothetical protein